MTIDRQALKAAAEWHAQLCADDAGPDRHAAHERWLRSAAEHRWAWQQVLALRARLGALPGPHAAAALDLAQAARRDRRNLLKGVALLVTAGGAGWLGVREYPALAAGYRTALGERRSFTLADGSTLILNTDSSADVRYDAQQRLIRLHAGEILVQSAPDPAPVKRPLRVQTRDGVVEALGTRFTVRQLAHATRVGVEQHAVELRPADDAAARQRLAAGQQGEFSRNAVLGTGPSADGPASWVNGMLVVADMPLERFVAELSRYRRGHLGCAPEVARLRLSGAFPIDDTERALLAVERALPVRIRRFTRYWTQIEAAGA
ncbi:FecR domain-containing protein [Pseudothauera rhizosphaerae]|uniref:FecR domain-containing protein n=1 Tax=Pseudothauera rhizosphaerae TaxID=2565932 RepID=UPI001454C5A9|nr:FecR domain-containing protein [Pseudothauera rhizosphaerae]